MKNNGSIDSTTFKFLNEKKIATRIGRFYLLPKIHKLEKCTVDKIKYEGYCDANIIPVSRPIISQIGTATENIAHYVDHFLLPIVNVQTTYIRDSSYFINKVERLRPHANCLLVSFDISSMYTNVQFDELLTAIESAYEAFDKTIYEITAPPTQDILDLVKLILENNVFEFNSKTYKQTIGCAMGVRCSPSICDIRIFEVINQITMKLTTKKKSFTSEDTEMTDLWYIMAMSQKYTISLKLQIRTILFWSLRTKYQTQIWISLILRYTKEADLLNMEYLTSNPILNQQTLFNILKE